MLFMTTIDSRLLGDSVSRTKGIFMIEKKSKGNANIFWKVTLRPLLAGRISKASHPNQVLTLSSFFLFSFFPFFSSFFLSFLLFVFQKLSIPVWGLPRTADSTQVWTNALRRCLLSYGPHCTSAPKCITVLNSVRKYTSSRLLSCESFGPVYRAPVLQSFLRYSSSLSAQ